MLLATVSAILILALIVVAFFGLKSYRPTRVSVVEQARVPHDVRAKVNRAKVNTVARLRLRLHQQRRAGRIRPPAPTPSLVPVSSAVSPPTTAPARPTPPPPDTHPPALIQHSLVHNRSGAPRPGSYFRIVEAPSQESITSDVRGPWAAQIVTRDGRITLPDSDGDVPLAWGGTE